MKPQILLLLCFILVTGGLDAFSQAVEYDLVLANGRVMDPESGLDAVRHVGITGGRIEAVSETPLKGKETIDAAGSVVAPGFIDVHSHGQNLYNTGLQARDGVTTALELEFGVYPAKRWYEAREGKAYIHYGASASHIEARVWLKHQTYATGYLTRDKEFRGMIDRLKGWVHDPLTADELAKLETQVEETLDDGGVGIGLGIQYTPGANREEILRLFRLAARRGVLVTVHVRYGGVLEHGGVVDAVQEMIANAAITGAAVHICHIGSMGLTKVPVLLDMIDDARANGIDITTEIYPYTAGCTVIGAAIFEPGWRDKLAADYEDIEWVETGERLTEETFNRYREEQPGGLIICHSIPPDEVRRAVAHPGVIVSSDSIPFVDDKGHPRGAGTFARLLGYYSREEGVLPLMEALRKVTILPAKRLESFVPAMKRKGRIQPGADADITVFDPQRIIDRATFQNPVLPSEGIPHVLVGGTFIVRGGELQADTYPGRAVKSEFSGQ